MKDYKLLALFVLVTLFLNANSAFAQKLKAEDIIPKHLDSIGKAETRASIKNRVIVGDVKVRFISQKGLSPEGRVVLASAGEKNFLGMRLNSANYSSEKFSFDGKKVKVGFVRTGTRSILGNFVLSNRTLLEESLLGGTLSSSWALLNLTNKKAKISFEGTKKIDGKETYVLGYSPKGGSDIDIKLYFDKETFRHVRNEYQRISSASIGLRPEDSPRNTESRFRVTEDFSDFKAENGLTLPHSYSLLYSVTGQNGTTEIEWSFNLTEFAVNQNLAESTFDAEAN